MTHTSIVANFSLTKKVALIVREEISYETSLFNRFKHLGGKEYNFLEVIFFLSDKYGRTIYDTVSTKQYLEYSFFESCFSVADMCVYVF